MKTGSAWCLLEETRVLMMGIGRPGRLHEVLILLLRVERQAFRWNLESGVATWHGVDLPVGHQGLRLLDSWVWGAFWHLRVT
jgi:hypothetical protein